MIGLLAKVIIGVACGGVIGGVAVGVYILLNPEKVKDEINKNIQDNDDFKEAFKAKVKEKSADGRTMTCEILDEWDEPLGDIDIHGDEIDSSMHIGYEIILRTAC